MSPYRAGHPRAVDEALKFLSETPDLLIAAGCTDLMVSDVEVRVKSTHVMSVLEIDELQGIEKDKEHMRIGSAATFSEIGSHSGLSKSFPILTEMARQIGGWQIQNRATIGGNIVNASPAGDALPVLLALDASLEIAGPGGRRTIPYEAMSVAYRKTALARGELLVAVRIPLASAEKMQGFRKVAPRRAQAISKVVVAMSARSDQGALRDVRVAAGSVAEIPVRLRQAEAVLEGSAPGTKSSQAGAAAAREVSPIDDVRSTERYRRWALERVVARMADDFAPAKG